jgi:homoserine O-acetyltransferase
MKVIGDTLKIIGNTTHDYIEVNSDYGHDAFLVELEKFDTYVKEVLDGTR